MQLTVVYGSRNTNRYAWKGNILKALILCGILAAVGLVAGCTKSESESGQVAVPDEVTVASANKDTESDESYALGKVKVITDASFDKYIANGVTLIDFWSPQCAPCLRQGPIVEEIAEDFVGSVRVGKLNVGRHRDVAMRLGITMIPTIMVFKDGKKVEELVGLRPKRQLAALLGKYLKK